MGGWGCSKHFTDAMVIGTGTSSRHLYAAANAVRAPSHASAARPGWFGSWRQTPPVVRSLVPFGFYASPDVGAIGVVIFRAGNPRVSLLESVRETAGELPGEAAVQRVRVRAFPVRAAATGLTRRAVGGGGCGLRHGAFVHQGGARVLRPGGVVGASLQARELPTERRDGADRPHCELAAAKLDRNGERSLAGFAI